MTHSRKRLYLIPVLLFAMMAPVLWAADVIGGRNRGQTTFTLASNGALHSW